MNKTGPPKDHYVPQLLLRNFSYNGTHIHAFDKRKITQVTPNIAGIVCEHEFNDKATEKWLNTEIESPSGPVIAQICERGEIGFLDSAQRNIVARFTAVQYLRSKSHRERIVDFDRAIKEHFRQYERDSESLDEVVFVSGEMAKDISLSSLEDVDAYTQYFHNKRWLLFKASGVDLFNIGDAPVVMDNRVGRQMERESYGLDSPGIEIYLPLHPQYTIAFYCPSVEFVLRQNYSSYQQRSESLSPVSQHIQQMLQSIDHGHSVPIDGDDIWRLNWLQVRNAERFVMSVDGNFGNLKATVEAHESLRQSPRLDVNPGRERKQPPAS